MANAYNSLVRAAQNLVMADSVYAGSIIQLVDGMRSKFCTVSNLFAEETRCLLEDTRDNITIDLSDMRCRLDMITSVTIRRIKLGGGDPVKNGAICEDAVKKITELFCCLKALMEKTAKEASEDQETRACTARICALIAQCIDTRA